VAAGESHRFADEQGGESPVTADSDRLAAADTRASWMRPCGRSFPPSPSRDKSQATLRKLRCGSHPDRSRHASAAPSGTSDHNRPESRGACRCQCVSPRRHPASWQLVRAPRLLARPVGGTGPLRVSGRGPSKKGPCRPVLARGSCRCHWQARVASRRLKRERAESESKHAARVAPSQAFESGWPGPQAGRCHGQ
jgi:hypothetical protein